MISRHKVFISYYHNDDQNHKNELIKQKYYNPEKKKFESIFEDYSVNDGDIDDSNMSAESIRRLIRDKYIKEAKVLILLCGQNTRKRKHVDWEIHAAMYDSEINPKMGIVVINLPTINQSSRVADEQEKVLVYPNSTWYSYTTREEYERNYPYMPSRIIDNFVRDVPIAVINWSRIKDNPEILMKLIDNAFSRRKYLQYDHSAPLRKNNS